MTYSELNAIQLQWGAAHALQQRASMGLPIADQYRDWLNDCTPQHLCNNFGAQIENLRQRASDAAALWYVQHR